MLHTILLRDVTEDDLKIFFEQERDPVANLLAAFPARDEIAFAIHWKVKLNHKHEALVKTIVFNDIVVGSIESWLDKGKWLLGYWIGREYWNKGITTIALQKFLELEEKRPLYAYVASHNQASMRVLEKCGFTVSGHGTIFSEVHGRDVAETHFIRVK